MLNILSITGPIYLIILLGYLTTRNGLFARSDMQVIGKFVINLAIPALLFKVSSERELGEIFNPSYLLAYLIGSLVVVGGGYFWSRKIRRYTATVATFNVLGMSCSNTGFIGFPILLLFLEPIAGICFALNILVENLVILPLILALAERSQGGDMVWYRLFFRTMARLALNPLIIALTAGVLISVSPIELPVIIARTVDLLAVSCTALALFFIGGTLVGVKSKGNIPRISAIVVGKLIFHPLAVFVAILLLPVIGLPALDAPMAAGAVISAAVPMLSIYSILALKYGEEDICSAAMLVTTLLSFITLNLLLVIINHAL